MYQGFKNYLAYKWAIAEIIRECPHSDISNPSQPQHKRGIYSNIPCYFECKYLQEALENKVGKEKLEKIIGSK